MTSDAIDGAWEAIEAGDPQRALELLRDADGGAARVARALARLDLGELDEAEREVEAARDGLAPEDRPDWSLARGWLWLERWRPREAAEALRAIPREDRTAFGLERLALALDLLGDRTGADRALARAAALDPTVRRPSLDEDAFVQVIHEAVARLPAPFREALEEAELVLEPVPPLELVGTGIEHEHPPDLLGLFVGASLLERSVEASAELPPRIYLFQRNLERTCTSRDELVEQTTVTLYHELGHMLGFDEDGVAAMGLE